MEEKEVLEEEGVNTLIMLEDDVEEEEDADVVEDWSLAWESSLNECLYLAHGLMGVTTVNLRYVSAWDIIFTTVSWLDHLVSLSWTPTR